MKSLVEAIEQRRAARSFKPDPIPPETLAEILRLGTRAPSGFNLQPWRFVVVTDADRKAELRSCAFDQRQVTEAPVVLVCCGDRRVSESDYVESVIRLGQQHDAVPDKLADYWRSAIPQVFSGQPSFGSLEVWTNRQVMLAVAHVMVAAQALGVDSCPMEGFVGDRVKAAFQIPDAVDVCCLLPLGYAAEPYKTYGGRFELPQVCFGDRYGNPLSLES